MSTLRTATGGQAFDLDLAKPGGVWSIDRKGGTVVESRMPISATLWPADGAPYTP